MSIDIDLHSHFPDPLLSDIRGPAEADFTAYGIRSGLMGSKPPSVS